jgi:hypothetical protein
MTIPVHPMLIGITSRLKLEPNWVRHGSDGTSLVVTETGCWLSMLDERTLHIEARAATALTDPALAVEFCDDRNQFALVGRWLYDHANGVAALVLDLCLDPTAGYDVEAVASEAVAEIINAVATVQYVCAPQRDLTGRKAVPALHGKVRGSRHPVDEHLPRHTYRLGSDPDAAHRALTLTQDVVLEPLLEWDVDHQTEQSVADHKDGSRLLLRAAQHPHAGWGLVVSLRPTWTTTPAGLNDLNSRAGLGWGRWVTVPDGVEHRAFLPNALLQAAGTDAWAPAQLVVDVIESALAQRTSIPAEGSAVQRPVWPGDDLGAEQARRDPWHDPSDDDPESDWSAVYLDRFGRMATITESSFDAWLDLLTQQDKADPSTAGFIDFMTRCLLARGEKNDSPASERSQAHSFGLEADHES